jgi:non-specific serine/threonine protein kinase
MDADHDISSASERLARRVAEDLARLRLLLVDAEEALAAALAHVSESQPLLGGKLERDLNVIRSIRAGLDRTDSAHTTTPPGATQEGPALEGLTSRERDVAILLARGLTNRQIAERLVISPATVGVHVEHIFFKLGLHTRAQLAAWIAGQQKLADQ